MSTRVLILFLSSRRVTMKHQRKWTRTLLGILSGKVAILALSDLKGDRGNPEPNT